MNTILKVKGIEKENEDIFSVYLKGIDERFAARHAGQYVSIRVMTKAGWSMPHPFTISSAPEDDYIRLTIKKMGEFTSGLMEIKPDAEVKCTGPLGVFCKGIENNTNIAMIAGGVGITPFLSVLRHFRQIGSGNRVTLFWTNRTLRETFSGPELEEMTDKMDLKVVHTLSRDKDAGNHFKKESPDILYETGYATRSILAEYADVASSGCYLCGPPAMQNFILGELDAMGVEKSMVNIETFSFKKP